MATEAQLKQRVRDYLYGAYPTDSPFYAQLGASYTSGTTSITVDDGANWDAGDILENLGTEEQFYVKSVSGAVLTVIPGFGGTTQAASAGADDTIVKNPRFSAAQIDSALDRSLKSLNNWGIHGFAQGSFVRNDMQKDFWEVAEVDIDPVYRVLEAYYVETNNEVPRPLPFRNRADLGSGPTEYTGGEGILILGWGEVSEGESVHYIYAQVYDDVTEPVEGEEEELLVLGACVLLMGGTIAPATQDPGARTDRTVQGGQTSRDVRFFQGEFFQRVRTQAAKVAIQREKFRPSTVRYARARRWRA